MGIDRPVAVLGGVALLVLAGSTLGGRASAQTEAPESEPAAHEVCTSCHVDPEGPALIELEPALCLGCHESRTGAGEHRIEIEPPTWPSPLLPLAGGRVTCISCHDFHATEPPMLWLHPRDLCQACHPR